MARKRSYPAHQCPYHVTARCLNQERFALPMPQVWKIFSHHFYCMTLAHAVRIHAFALMSNHFHLLMTASEQTLDKAIVMLLEEVSHAIENQTKAPFSVFEDLGHRTAIKNRVYYQHAYKYVYRNPLTAGLCQKVEQYPYSTLRGILGHDQLSFPVFDNMDLIVNPAKQLEWLNTPYPFEDLFCEALEKGAADLVQCAIGDSPLREVGASATFAAKSLRDRLQDVSS